jgi:hypothetical protein
MSNSKIMHLRWTLLRVSTHLLQNLLLWWKLGATLKVAPFFFVFPVKLLCVRERLVLYSERAIAPPDGRYSRGISAWTAARDPAAGRPLDIADCFYQQKPVFLRRTLTLVKCAAGSAAQNGFTPKVSPSGFLYRRQQLTAGWPYWQAAAVTQS